MGGNVISAWVGVIDWGRDVDLDIRLAHSEHGAQVACIRAVLGVSRRFLRDIDADELIQFLEEHPEIRSLDTNDQEQVGRWFHDLNMVWDPLITVQRVTAEQVSETAAA